MPGTSALTKRIKRHVIARPQRFFAATAPGFEKACLQELTKRLPDIQQTSATPGGVEFVGRLEDGFRANLNLHTPNRILMRIDTFKSTNFRQLEKKTGDIAWELYMRPDSGLRVHVATRHCRLRHSAAIAERIGRVISEQLSGVKPEQYLPETAGGHQDIFVRGADDHFSVSIDSSGDLLYKRGLKEHTGKAPLRETLAAGALILADYSGFEPLLDPLCGTGTFSLEGALMTKRIPAGWFRDFAFSRWPSFTEKRWDYIKRQAASKIVQSQRPVIFASDIDGDACQKLKTCIQKHHLDDTIRVQRINFFNLDPLELTDRTGTICINPPYGRRLGKRKEAETFFHAVGDKLKQAYRGWKLVLLAPGRRTAGTLPFRVQSIPLQHGGLKLRLLIGKIE
jgi:putative N6-adenine-specific DNA methylase